MFRLATVFGEVTGGICDVLRRGERNRIALCARDALEVVSRETGQMSKHDLVEFIASSCALPRIEVDESEDFLLADGWRMEIRKMSGAGSSDQFAAFKSELRDYDPLLAITSCETILMLPVGTAHGNRSYGGLCDLEGTSGAKLAICDDEMVGHSKIRILGKEAMSKREIAVFTAAYCAAG
jgi:hypothetical protein